VITYRPLQSSPQHLNLGLILISYPVMLLPPTPFHFLGCFLKSKFSLLMKEDRIKCSNSRFTGQHILTQQTGPRTNSDPVAWTWVGSFSIRYVRFPSGAECGEIGTEMRKEAPRRYRNTWKANHLLQNNSVKSQISRVE